MLINLYHSGLDVGNTILDTALLDALPSYMKAKVDIDVIQDYGMFAQVMLPALIITTVSYHTVNTDFVELQGVYYYVIDAHKTSSDTVQLTLAVEPVLSSEALVLLDGKIKINPVHDTGKSNRFRTSGIVKRKTGATSTAIIDPLLTPNSPAKTYARTVWCYDDGALGVSDYKILLASTIDLDSVNDEGTQSRQALYNLGEDGTLSILNSPVAIGQGTYIRIGGASGVTGGMGTYTPGVQYYDMSNSTVKRKLQAVRAWGWENSIIGAYAIPEGLVDLTIGSNGKITQMLFDRSLDKWTATLYIPSTAGVDVTDPVLLKSPAFTVGIMAVATGSQVTMQGNQAFMGGRTECRVSMLADPRIGGCPYFFFLDSDLIVDSPNPIAKMLMRGVAGSQWKSAPITYVQSSGYVQSAIDMIRNQVYTVQTGNLELQKMQWEGVKNFASSGAQALSGIGAFYNISDSVTAGNIASAPGASNIASGIGGMLGSMVNTQMSMQDYDNLQALNMRREREAWDLHNQYVAPQVAGIPTPSMQDLAGNGCILYSTIPDMDRLHAIANHFGLACNEDFGPDFEAEFSEEGCAYIQVADASINNYGSKYSGVILRALTSALGAGVRIWNTLPGGDIA